MAERVDHRDASIDLAVGEILREDPITARRPGALSAGLLARAEILARMGRLKEAQRAAERALALARKHAEPELILRALSIYPRLAFYSGEDDGGSLARAKEAVTVAEDSGNAPMRLLA